MSKLKLVTGMAALGAPTEDRRLYRDYLRKIDVEAVLNHYGADNMDQQGDEIVHSCLLDRIYPHHNNGDANPSALANVEDKLYLCRTYSDWKGGDIIQFVIRMEQANDFTDVIPLLSTIIGETSEDRASNFREELDKILHPKTKAADAPMPKLHDRALRGWATYHPFLEDRGISMEAAKRLQIGYDPKAVRITYPHWVDGTLVGWQKRHLTDPRWTKTPDDPLKDSEGNISGWVNPKYKNSVGFPKHSTLYNLDRVRARGKDTVIVVESPMSVAMAETLMTGDDDLLAGTLAVFGAKMPDEQLIPLRQFKRIYVYMDDDNAGQGASRRLTEAMKNYCEVYVVRARDGKDMGDYRSRAALMRVIDKAEPSFLALARWNREAKEREDDRKRLQQRESVSKRRARVPRARA